MKTKDKFGVDVKAGTRVRILNIDSVLKIPLDKEEKKRVESMLGEVFDVYEVDKYGNAWVEKWWHYPDKTSSSHSIALTPEEMEVVTE